MRKGLRCKRCTLSASSSARRSAQGVQLQPDLAFDAQGPPDFRSQLNELRIHIRAGHAERLRPDLVELAVAAQLRPLVAEHGAAVEDPLRLIVQQAVLQQGAYAGGGAFRTQGNAVPVPVHQAEHLLFDDVRRSAYAAAEQLGGFEQRQAHLLIGEAFENIDDGVLHLTPAPGLLRQDVPHASYRAGHGYRPSTREATRSRVCGAKGTGTPLNLSSTPGL